MMPCGIWLGWAIGRDLLVRLLVSAVALTGVPGVSITGLISMPVCGHGCISLLRLTAGGGIGVPGRVLVESDMGYVGKRFVRSGLKKDYESCPGRNANAWQEEIIAWY